ncbi:MAG: hypothetical protein H6978_11605 [Gammaproteobacteria bacterium]|nr:hypothetical protein [Gammaproteobacteria bacterium]
MRIEEIGEELQRLECKSQALKWENQDARRQLRKAVCARAASPLVLAGAALFGMWWGAGHKRTEPPFPQPGVGVQTAQTVSMLGVAVTAVKLLDTLGTVIGAFRRDRMNPQIHGEN